MKYQQSHPWITFHINLEKMSHDLWIKLGQVHASCELISGIPLHPDVQAHLHGVYAGTKKSVTKNPDHLGDCRAIREGNIIQNLIVFPCVIISL